MFFNSLFSTPNTGLSVFKWGDNYPLQITRPLVSLDAITSGHRITGFSNPDSRILMLFITHYVMGKSSWHYTQLDLVVSYCFFKGIRINFGALFIEILASHYQFQKKLALGPQIHAIMVKFCRLASAPADIQEITRVFDVSNLNKALAHVDKQAKIAAKIKELNRVKVKVQLQPPIMVCLMTLQLLSLNHLPLPNQPAALLVHLVPDLLIYLSV